MSGALLGSSAPHVRAAREVAAQAFQCELSEVRIIAAAGAVQDDDQTACIFEEEVSAVFVPSEVNRYFDEQQGVITTDDLTIDGETCPDHEVEHLPRAVTRTTWGQSLRQLRLISLRELRGLPQEFGQVMVNLEILVLCKCGVVSLPPMPKCLALREVQVFNCRLTGVSSELPPRVELLDLRNNLIREVTMRAEASSLRSLLLADNPKLYQVDLGSHLCPRLSVVSAGGTCLKKIRGHAPTLGVITVSVCRRSPCPPAGLSTLIGNHSRSLRTLRLSVCGLFDWHLDEVRDPLLALEVLELDRNNLRRIPENWVAARSLENISVQDNMLHSLPRSLGHTSSSLLYLNVSHNRSLRTLPQSLSQCPKLSEIRLKGCRLDRLPTGCAKLCTFV